MRYGPNLSKKPITAPYVRFRKKISESKDGCWIWQGHIGAKGYGTFFDGAEMQQAHRWSYTHYVGEIPEGLVLDHLCHNRACVNPDHLEAVTNQENSIRGFTGFHLLTIPKATHCGKGHRLWGENISKIGACRQCAKERHKIWYESTKSERLPLFNAKRRKQRAEKRKQAEGI